ncbi:hypothetical protein RU639_013108 [Aspergillus parasiticus]
MGLPRAFEEGLQTALDKRQQLGYLFSLAPSIDKSKTVDFGTNDTLSLVSSGALREEVLREIERNPGFEVGSCGSRVNEGTPYIAELERYLARVHRAPDGLFFSSGYDANSAIYSTLPRDGDAILYDSLVHASIHDGMKITRASILKPFDHNNLVSLHHMLGHVKDSSVDIRLGRRTVFIAIESVYSMDGDVAPAKEIVDLLKADLPHGNFILIVDEAHSNGLLGPNGAGYISALGLEKEYAIRLQTCGKALGAVGAIVLCDPLVKSMLVGFARMFIFTTAPTFLMAATVKAAYNILSSEDGKLRRLRLQQNMRYFYELLERQPQWQLIQQEGHISLPCAGNWKNAQFLTPIIPLITKEGKCVDLRNKLRQESLSAIAVKFPAVSKDSERVRVVMHADNTEEQISTLVKTVIDWASSQTLKPETASSVVLRSRI